MLNALKDEIKKTNITKAIIIDDAFDDPDPSILKDENIQRFINTLNSDDDFSNMLSLLKLNPDGNEDYLAAELVTPENTSFLFHNKNILTGVQWDALFGDFSRKQSSKKLQLEPLENLLGKIDVDYETYSTSIDELNEKADMIFIDLYFSDKDTDEDVIDQSVEKIRLLIAQYDPDKIPIVVLISTRSLKIKENHDLFREKSQLMGSQFAYFDKKDFQDHEARVSYHILRLASSLCATRNLKGLQVAWLKALSGVQNEFKKAILKYELSDYADLKSLVLDSEDQSLGHYFIDLYNSFLLALLEEDRDLNKVSKKLDSLELLSENYPPNQFSPVEYLSEIKERLCFHSGAYVNGEASSTVEFNSLRIGDLLSIQDGQVQKYFLVICQNCDILRLNIDYIFLIPGIVQNNKAPSILNSIDGLPNMQITIDSKQKSLSWSPKKSLPISKKEYENKDEDENNQINYRRIARLRLPWALQVQHKMLSHMGRVGTMAMPHESFELEMAVFLRSNENMADKIFETKNSENSAVFSLAGRTQDSRNRYSIVISHPALIDLVTNLGSNQQDDKYKPVADSIKNLIEKPDGLDALRSKIVLHDKFVNKHIQLEPLDHILVDVRKSPFSQNKTEAYVGEKGKKGCKVFDIVFVFWKK